MTYTYNYPMPAITADTIVYQKLGDRILLIKRKDDPYKGYWALPGGFFNPLHTDGTLADESIMHAAKRELMEETNLDFPLDRFKFVKTQDAIGRDSRGRVVTFVYSVTSFFYKEYLDVRAKDDAEEVAWIPVRQILDGTMLIAFDHQNSICHFIRTR